MRRPHVVIIGGGFGGLAAAKTLRNHPLHITIIDQRNHHLFQPLLYEVATAALSPADVAVPIRRVFRRHPNVEVLLGKATDISLADHSVILQDGTVEYDYLIVAAGVTHSYFGRRDWATIAPGLKTAEDALEIRRRFLLSFEAAEREADPDAARARLTFVIVGAGPTGVELAGTMSEIARRALPLDFRSIDTATAQVVLLEGQSRVLPSFDENLSEIARRDLEALGVDVRTDSIVTSIDDTGVSIGEARIHADNIFWAAGVEGSPLGACLTDDLDEQGRVRVESDLSLPGHPEVFIIGDLAHAVNSETGAPVPGVAPAAKQMGQHVGELIARDAAAGVAIDTNRAFSYTDRGMLATVGRAKAVGTIFGRHVSGAQAWILWAAVHIFFLIDFGNRLVVTIRWVWAYIAFSRGARLITGNTHIDLTRARKSMFDDEDECSRRSV